MTKRLVAGCLLAISFSLPTEAEEWTRFRGGDGNACTSLSSHPVRWSGTENVAWSLEISGGGWSSPIVSGEKVFLTTAVATDGEKPKNFQDGVRNMVYKPEGPLRFEVWCVDPASGKTLWKTVLAETAPKYPIHPSNTYATESPACDRDRVFVYFGSIGLVAALDHKGKTLWSQDVGVYPMNANFGTGSSPIVSEKLVFIQCDNNEGSFLLALDKESGEEAWKKERPTGSSWSTPILWNSARGPQLVACGPGNAVSYEPGTGKVLWELSPIQGSFTASPISDRDRIYFGNSGPGTRGPLVAVKAEATGELNLPDDPKDVAWVLERSGPGMASPVLSGGLLYVMGSMGILDCYRAESGDRVYRKRLTGIGSVVSSLWVNKDHLYVLDETGKTLVIATGEDYELVSTNEISDLFWATPSVKGEELLLRGANKLYCIRKDP